MWWRTSWPLGMVRQCPQEHQTFIYHDGTIHTRVTYLSKIWLQYQDSNFLTHHFRKMTHPWSTCIWKWQTLWQSFWLTWDLNAPVRQFYDWPFGFDCTHCHHYKKEKWSAHDTPIPWSRGDWSAVRPACLWGCWRWAMGTLPIPCSIFADSVWPGHSPVCILYAAFFFFFFMLFCNLLFWLIFDLFWLLNFFNQ